MPSYKELCLHQKRRPFNIKKYTLRWPLMWEMHDVLIIFYLHCDIWNILEKIDWHYFCMRWIMRISSFFSSEFTKLVIIYQFKLIIMINVADYDWWYSIYFLCIFQGSKQILTWFNVFHTENKNISSLCRIIDE